ncbi:endonuclease domain-containing protein [Candidatus Gracilibacteria bacterium]|nr:endonuclease domain-containing protein [Candidatus Gracilibacteria bacterium]
MRLNPTKAELLAWEKLFSNRGFYGYKFSRQKMLGYFIVDFYCSELQLVVEIDGGIHDSRKEYDSERECELQKIGVKVIRYTNAQILKDVEGVYYDLAQKLNLGSPG